MIKIYEQRYTAKGCLYVHDVVVKYHEDDQAEMYGHFYADNIWDIARIIKTYKLVRVQ